jgi:hypothetical protein
MPGLDPGIHRKKFARAPAPLSCPGPASARYADGAPRLRASAEPGPSALQRQISENNMALRASCAGSTQSQVYLTLRASKADLG